MSTEAEQRSRNPVRIIGKKLLAPVTNLLAKCKVEPNTVTNIGRELAALGTIILMYQDVIAEEIHERFNVSITKARVGAKIVGGTLWLAGAICDGEDGDLAEKLNKKTSLGKYLDAVTDRDIDTLAFILNRESSKHPVEDAAVSELNLATVTMPALLKTVKPDVKELGIGSRFPRLVTHTVFLLFPEIRRVAGLILMSQSVATAYSRYRDIQDNGTEDMRQEADRLLMQHAINYLESKFSIDGLVFGLSTRDDAVEEYAAAKKREILKEDPKAIIPDSWRSIRRFLFF